MTAGLEMLPSICATAEQITVKRTLTTATPNKVSYGGQKSAR